jgi:hypothetical protein
MATLIFGYVLILLIGLVGLKACIDEMYKR